MPEFSMAFLSRGDLVYLTSHDGNKFGCGQVLCFLTNNHGDDVAVMNLLHLTKLAETFAEWEDRKSHVVVPLEELLVAVTCQGQAKDHNFDPMEL